MGPCCSKTCLTTIETQEDLPCAPREAYQIMIDFNKYPEWNNNFRIEGNAVAGTPLEVHFLAQDMKLQPVVLVADPTVAEFRWRGKLCCVGCFDGEHYFRFEPKPMGRSIGTTFTHGESFAGCLVCTMKPCLGCLILDKTSEGFRQFNSSMKRRVDANAML